MHQLLKSTMSPGGYLLIRVGVTCVEELAKIPSAACSILNRSSV